MTSVNRPTNIKQKEQDVNQKLQLYGIYSAFALGKVPSNKQIDIALNSAIASKPLATPSAKLSDEGKLLVNDLKDVIEKAKILLLSKNDGDLLQDFIWQSQQVSGGNATLPGAPVDKATAQQHGNEALEGLRTLGTLLLSNGQFRKLLNDATILLRDIAGDGAQSAATRINPSQDALGQIDHPADDNTWHDVPDLSAANLKAQARDTYGKNKPFGKGDVQNATGQAVNTATADGTATEDDIDARGGATTAMNNLKSTASENVPDETKDKARNLGNRTKGYLGDKMPKERREQTIYRLKKMIVEIQGHSDYQQAIETLLSLAEQYGSHGRNMGQQGTGSVKGAHADTALTSAETDLKTLLERFANSSSADDMIDAIKTIYSDAEKDPELRGWFSSVDTYIRKNLKEPGFIMQDTANQEWDALYDKGNFLLREKYRGHTNHLLDEIKAFGLQFDEDPQNKAFALSMQKLFNDLGNDQNGKPVFKKHLVTDLSNVILPGIFESVRYIPVPRIEYSDPMIDAVVENLIIEGDNLAPNSLEFGSDNYFRWGRKTVASKSKNKFMISASGIQMDLRDVSYYVNKKQGFPSIKDTGVMDIFMGGSGFSFKAQMESADKSDKAHFFKITKVDVDIKSLTIKLKQSKHKLLFNLIRPLLFAVLRPAIGKVLEKLIKDQVANADAKAYAINKEAEKAAQAVQNDPENAPNVYRRYADAARKVLTEKQAKAEEVSADKKANAAMTQNESIFPQIKLPGGISSKATEYQELAKKGDKWESPVFGIGSASVSTNVPKVAAVTRKSKYGGSGVGGSGVGGSGVGGGNSVSNATTGYGGGNSMSNTSAGYGGNSSVSNATAGFGNEVNQAFSGGNNNLYLKNATGANGSAVGGTV